jgi:hypothetical protein
MRIVIKKVADRPVFLRVLPFFPVYIIPPMLHTNPHPHICSYQKDKLAKLGKLPRKRLAEIGEQSIEHNFLPIV